MTTPSPHSLETLQQWMQSVITHPKGVVAGIEAARPSFEIAANQIEDIVPSSQKLDAISKLEVYGNAYYARLIGCLGDEYPALKFALGDETFTSFAFSYLQEHPSRSYTLSELGKQFPAFLKRTKPTERDEPGWAEFLVDLARLEWHYSEIFNGPGSEKFDTLSADLLKQLSPEQFARSRLVVSPDLRLDYFRFPVHEYATSVRKQKRPANFPSAKTTWLVMSRRKYIVRRVAVSEAEYSVLKEIAIADPVPIGSILERISADWGDVMTLHLQSWFSRWAAAGYFTDIEEIE